MSESVRIYYTMRTPKYRKHSSRDCAYVEWRGKRYYLPGLHNSRESVEAYKQFLSLNVFAVAPQSVERPSPSGLTVAGLVLAYLTHAQGYYGGGSRGEYSNVKCAVMPLAEAYGHLPAVQFGPLKLKEHQAALAAKEQNRNYANAQTARIKRAFKWAVSEELIPASVYQSLVTVQGLRSGATPAKESAPKDVVPWEVVEATLAELNPTVGAMVRLQWHTGARSGSICHATPAQFDRSGSLWLWRPKHKTQYLGRELVIPIGPRCQAVLLPFMDRPADQPLFSPRSQRANRRYNTRYNSGSYAQAIDRAVIRVSATRAKEGRDPIPAWTPHQLRHSKGQAIRDRYGIEAQQAVLGHDSLEATQIYSARRLELAKEIAAEIG